MTPNPDRQSRTWESDLDDSLEITEHEMVVDGPERDVDEAVIQTYRHSDGGWDYIPEPI